MGQIPSTNDVCIDHVELSAVEYLEMTKTLDQLLMPNPASTFLGRVEGESMIDVGIFPNDLLIIDRAETVKNGAVIVATLNGTFVCKLADTKNMSLLSASTSGDYPAYELTPEDDFSVEGVVVACVRLHRPLSRGHQ